jgi:adiponectin receptor
MTVGLAKTASDASHKLQDHATHLVAQVVDHCDLPEWMQKDVYITHGYRLEENSFHGCYRSLWYLHNETVNVWSHLLTGIFFLSLFLWSALPVLHSGYTFSAGDLLALQSYLVGAIICLFFSVSYKPRLRCSTLY